MAVIKRSVSLDADIAKAIEQQAEAEGVAFSTWLNEAARKALKRTAALAAIREWEAEHGAFTEQELEEADRLLDNLGVLRSDTP